MRSDILTVVTPATSQDLTTLEIAKEELGITDSASDSLLARWISEASESIAGYCNRSFGQEKVTEIFMARDRLPGALSLRRYPVVSVDSITEALDTDDIVDGTDALDPSAYVVDNASGLIYRTGFNAIGCCDWPYLRLAVTYTGGYNLPDDVPLRLQRGCLLMLNHLWAARGRDPMLRQVNIPGVIEKTFWVGGTGDNLPPEVAERVQGFMEFGL